MQEISKTSATSSNRSQFENASRAFGSFLPFAFDFIVFDNSFMYRERINFMLLVPTSQLVIENGIEHLLQTNIRQEEKRLSYLLFVAVDGVAAGVAGAVYPDE